MERDAISDLHRATLGLEFDLDGEYLIILQWIPALYFQPCSLQQMQKTNQHKNNLPSSRASYKDS